ncbi:GDSL-type esterase/lipase family protein [Actinocorallia longicatena]|uniref:GDSL-type esterase/lipase family protein n=1 Tax=Actinocorallia longicatena TaxID=111803 RepID=A0ABP6PVT6_9ACTN
MTSSTDGAVPIMIVGDSISHGSSGDWTWRYRFWTHLRDQRVAIDLVGPKATLDDIRTAEAGDDDSTYADPEFDRDHNAQWGRPYLTEKSLIEAKVAEFRPAYLLVLLGINDLFWYGVEPGQFEDNLREFVANARRAAPSLRFVLGSILQTQRAVEDEEFAARVAACNARIRAVAASMTTPESPIVLADTAREFVAADHTWDGTHPNPRGELRIAAAFADVLAGAFALGAPYPRPFTEPADIPAQAKAPLGEPAARPV